MKKLLIIFVLFATIISFSIDFNIDYWYIQYKLLLDENGIDIKNNLDISYKITFSDYLFSKKWMLSFENYNDFPEFDELKIHFNDEYSFLFKSNYFGIDYKDKITAYYKDLSEDYVVSEDKLSEGIIFNWENLLNNSEYGFLIEQYKYKNFRVDYLNVYTKNDINTYLKNIYYINSTTKNNEIERLNQLKATLEYLKNKYISEIYISDPGTDVSSSSTIVSINNAIEEIEGQINALNSYSQTISIDTTYIENGIYSYLKYNGFYFTGVYLKKESENIESEKSTPIELEVANYINFNNFELDIDNILTSKNIEIGNEYNYTLEKELKEKKYLKFGYKNRFKIFDTYFLPNIKFIWKKDNTLPYYIYPISLSAEYLNFDSIYKIYSEESTTLVLGSQITKLFDKNSLYVNYNFAIDFNKDKFVYNQVLDSFFRLQLGKNYAKFGYKNFTVNLNDEENKDVFQKYYFEGVLIPIKNFYINTQLWNYNYEKLNDIEHEIGYEINLYYKLNEMRTGFEFGNAIIDKTTKLIIGSKDNNYWQFYIKIDVTPSSDEAFEYNE
ncbi:hypothetical protein SAMN02745164_00078 [Marinitoga hydrogenitolerans DSM 16785]|uniref:Uncharacterized protein n=1 Tax=Marinitoga hydrogenitolerans (strain DSM 16785 / JCM 12826 / AT1271) TaxID=1122195 RepID=A0A1M4S6B0_MARH1|nr:hypothetical protein [Marinitoga hydrogenitolerans]SHE27746.1 hypothetical protein SAMN02745164_00078 [Marinitoga hydrogenitolerans DSM 16785]